MKCINPKASQAQKIYESDGLATTLSALGGGGNIYSINGLCPTLTANDFKHPKWIVVFDEED